MESQSQTEVRKRIFKCFNQLAYHVKSVVVAAIELAVYSSNRRISSRSAASTTTTSHPGSFWRGRSLVGAGHMINNTARNAQVAAHLLSPMMRLHRLLQIDDNKSVTSC